MMVGLPGDSSIQKLQPLVGGLPIVAPPDEAGSGLTGRLGWRAVPLALELNLAARLDGGLKRLPLGWGIRRDTVPHTNPTFCRTKVPRQP